MRLMGLTVTLGRDRKLITYCDMQLSGGFKYSQGVEGKPEGVRECFLEKDQ